MPQPHPPRLLTTRVRIAVALALTALVFAQEIRGALHFPHAKPGWLLPGDFILHGWALIAANVLLYGYICWLAFWLIRGTAGRERFFMAGWFASILLWPVKMLRPGWAVAIKHIGAFGLLVALLAALSLLLGPAKVADSEQSPDDPITQ